MATHELACIGLGSNVGPARRSLEHAIAALAVLPGASLMAVSPLYRTRPVGPVAQADFLNAVVTLDVPAGREPAEGAMALLIALKGIERAIGRLDRERWGPREIDLDLLLFGSHRLRVERAEPARSRAPSRPGPQWLEVPHPAAHERLFVLAPLADLLPDLEPPGWGRTVATARERALAREGLDSVLRVATWDQRAGGWSGA